MPVSFEASGKGTSDRIGHGAKCLNLPKSMSELWHSGTSETSENDVCDDILEIMRITDDYYSCADYWLVVPKVLALDWAGVQLGF